MHNVAETWDERYQNQGYPAGTEPAEFLMNVLPLLPRGRALDLATGAGRNAVFLATHGWQLTAVDASPVALEKAEALAREHGVEAAWANSFGSAASSGKAQLLLLERDLEAATLPVGQFQLVICFNYLQRSLFPAIEHALAPGGVLVYETYTADQLAFGRGPHNPEHLLRRDELRAAFPSLVPLFYRQFSAGKGIASLVARKP